MSDTRFTNLQLRQTIRNNIIVPILSANGLSSIPVISDHQNAKIPDGTFLSYAYAPIYTRQGRNIKFAPEVSGTEEYNGEIRDTYTQFVRTDYELTGFDIKEYNGEGDILTLIAETIDTDFYRDKLTQLGIGILNIGQIQPIPELVNEDWIKVSVMELIMHIANGVNTDLETIESVNFNGTIE